MADPRFYDNKGPFTLGDLCTRLGISLPDGAASDAQVSDVASLKGAGPSHLGFVANWSADAEQSKAGFAFVPNGTVPANSPSGMLLIPVASPAASFSAAISLFYPDTGLGRWDQQATIHPSACIEASALLAPGVFVGPGAEIGANTRIGPGAVIGRGVTVGRNSEIGAHAVLSHAHVGDHVLILPHVCIGQPGFGFVSGPQGHAKIPQIGRVIVQDRVEIGANSTIDRGALGDTVIGEGTKIDNMVHIGHNTKIGRHCIIIAQVGISGSCELEDFVVLGGQVGLADHVHIGQGARFAARAGAINSMYPGGQDYGGIPARPIQQWKRETAAIAILARRKKRSSDV